MPLKHSRFINPLLDLSFKRIFGSAPNEDLLIEGRKVITDLVYNKKEHHSENKEEATAVFDLK